MEYGVQIYTLRKELKDEDCVRDVFDFLSASGATCVELATMPSIDAIKLKEMSQKAKVAIFSSHTSIEKLKSDIYKIIAEHLAYGAEYIAVCQMPNKFRKSEKSVKKFAKLVNKYATIIESYGLKLVYHNHDFEFRKVGEKTIFEILVSEFSPSVSFCVDCYWAYVGGQDVPALLTSLGTRLAFLHFKDYKKTGNVHSMCTLGEGILPLGEYIKIAEKQGVKYCLVELDEIQSPRKAVENSLKHLISLA